MRKDYFMKLKNYICLLIVLPFIIIFFSGCLNVQKYTFPNNVNKITFYKEGTSLTTFSYIDEEKINLFSDFFGNIELTATSKSPKGSQDYYSGGWTIRVYTDSEIYGINIIANTFYQTYDGKWWLISAEQISSLENLLRETVPDELPDVMLFDEWK